MSSSRLNLMSFVPRTDVSATVHTVGLPSELSAALFSLFPPKHEGDYLFTKLLKEDLRCWLDQAADLALVRLGEAPSEWLISLSPVDLGRLCNVIAVWVDATCDKALRGGAEYARVMELLQPESFSGCVSSKQCRLVDDVGRAADDMVFTLLPALASDALVGRPLYLPNGEKLVFDRIARGGGRGCELVSRVRWHDGCPWAFGLCLHAETLPIGGAVRLNLDVRVRRFAPGKWASGEPYLRKDVNALVRGSADTYRTVSYGYSRKARHLKWDARARANFELGGAQLPDLPAYLESMSDFAKEGAFPQILSPLSVSSNWARKTSVEAGASVADKAMLFGVVTEALRGMADPVPPIEACTLAKLSPVTEDASSRLWKKDEGAARQKHEEWVRATRERLAACTGVRRICFQLIGSSVDSEVLAVARDALSFTLGEAGFGPGPEIVVEELICDQLLAPLEAAGDAAERVRWREVENLLGQATGLTACIVALPGAASFPKSGSDPKRAIRMGLARTGRLSQFLVAETDKTLDARAQGAVRDLLRQLGVVPELGAGGGKFDPSMPVVGLRVANLSPKLRFPISVKVEFGLGLVSVECPLFSQKRIRYWQAQLELARLSTSPDFQEAVRRADGQALKRMVDELVAEGRNEELLLLVQAYGCIRWRSWWPGITDKALSSGGLTYGPADANSFFPAEATGLRILRVRSGADGEVPDYFTDAREATAGTNDGPLPRKVKQGHFVMDGYILSLTSKPYSSTYNKSHTGSKFKDPDLRFTEKTLNEYCLLTPGNMEDALSCARYAEALRGGMVHLYNSDMKVNLPAPLHLAVGLEEYVWVPGSK